MSDRIIDFNEIKNKAKEKDVDKLEEFMYSLYYDMADGKITITEFSKKMYDYMNENNISQDKFIDIQKKLISRYGIDTSIIDKELKELGLNLSEIEKSYNNIQKVVDFQHKYDNKLKTKPITTYTIKNDKNNIEIILDNENVVLNSSGKIDLNDNELNEFLCSYKKFIDGKTLKIKNCENTKEYDY